MDQICRCEIGCGWEGLEVAEGLDFVWHQKIGCYGNTACCFPQGRPIRVAGSLYTSCFQIQRQHIHKSSVSKHSSQPTSDTLPIQFSLHQIGFLEFRFYFYYTSICPHRSQVHALFIRSQQIKRTTAKSVATAIRKQKLPSTSFTATLLQRNWQLRHFPILVQQNTGPSR